MLSGATSYQAIAQFGRDKGTALAHLLGFRRGKTPAKSTFSAMRTMGNCLSQALEVLGLPQLE